LTTIKKKTIVDAVERYNKRVMRKIEDAKDDNIELLEQRRRFEETIDNDTYMAGLGSNPIVHRQYLLEIISYYEQMRREMVISIDMRKKINDNKGKIAVLNGLLGGSNSSRAAAQKIEDNMFDIPNSKIGESVKCQNPFEIKESSTDQASESELVALIEAAEAEQSRLANSLTNLQSRNNTLSSELIKTTNFITVARTQNLDLKKKEYEEEITDINQEIEMLTNS
jgi:hypothetical protein